MTTAAITVQASLSGKGTMADYQTVCRVEDLTEGEGRTIQVGNKLIAVFRDRGQVFAIDDTCPHMGASLSGGYLEQGIVTCPWHHWQFDLTTGVSTHTRHARVRRYAAEVRDGVVWVELPD